MAIIRLFASAREVAGRGRDEVPGATVAEVLETATDRYGSAFAAVLGSCRVWVNGEAVPPDTRVGPDDEVAVLPPVSGGAVGTGSTTTTTSTTSPTSTGATDTTDTTTTTGATGATTTTTSEEPDGG